MAPVSVGNSTQTWIAKSPVWEKLDNTRVNAQQELKENKTKHATAPNRYEQEPVILPTWTWYGEILESDLGFPPNGIAHSQIEPKFISNW